MNRLFAPVANYRTNHLTQLPWPIPPGNLFNRFLYWIRRYSSKFNSSHLLAWEFGSDFKRVIQLKWNARYFSAPSKLQRNTVLNVIYLLIKQQKVFENVLNLSKREIVPLPLPCGNIFRMQRMADVRPTNDDAENDIKRWIASFRMIILKSMRFLTKKYIVNFFWNQLKSSNGWGGMGDWERSALCCRKPQSSSWQSS